MQQTDRSEFGMETRCPDNASSSVAECSGEALAPTTFFAPNLRGLGESRPAIVDVSTFTIVEILGKRSSGSGVEYQFELVVACSLGGKGADGTRSHPNLRERTHTCATRWDIEVGKANFSQMEAS